MRLPRDISGRDLIAALGKAYGYSQVHQEGSHVVVETQEPRRHRISIPAHKTLRIGTLSAILRAVAKAQGVKKEELVQRLFG